MTTGFDTLEAAKHLQDAGIARGQAEPIATAIKFAQGNLATKTDIVNLEKRLEDKIDNLRWTVIVGAGVAVALVKFLS